MPKGKQYCGDAKYLMISAENTADFSNVTDFEHLYTSMLKCKTSVLWKDSVASFWLNGIERCLKLETEFETGAYKARQPRTFAVYVPKKRDIVSICFRDRVYQRALNDYVIYPIMTRSFIYDNWACQKGKGTDAARERLKEFMHRFYRRYGSEGYILKIDIKGYYPNMSHEVVEEMFKEKLPAGIFEQVVMILKSQYKGDKGYNPGSQLIQIAGISLLDKTDHFIKEHLRIKYYLRYMDDFILIHKDKEYLIECLRRIETELSKVKCSKNEKKTRIVTLKEGISFLGFDFRLTDTGKVLMLLRSENVKQERKRLRHMARKIRHGAGTYEKLEEMFEAWKAHAVKGNTYKVVRRMTGYYEGLRRIEKW